MTSKSKLPHLDASRDVTERRGVLVLAGLNAAAAERSVVATNSFIFTSRFVISGVCRGEDVFGLVDSGLDGGETADQVLVKIDETDVCRTAQLLDTYLGNLDRKG